MTGSGAKDRQADASKAAPAETGEKLRSTPLKPRKRLFLILLLIFVIWIGWLLAMYFQVVYPRRHRVAPVEPASASQR